MINTARGFDSQEIEKYEGQIKETSAISLFKTPDEVKDSTDIIN